MVTAATAMIYENGTVFIAVLVQVIDLTNKMDKGLINLNHCRSFGVQCVYGPTGTTRKLGFYANDVFLPLRTQVNNCIVDSFCPSDYKLQYFPLVFMSDE